MPDRRVFLASATALLPLARGWAAPAPERAAHVETRMFNLRTGISSEQANAAVLTLKRRAAEARCQVLTIGRNILPVQFPGRFEWVCLLQRPDFASQSALSARQRLQQALDELASLSANHVQCDVPGALPAEFSGATPGNVRHVVMFSFKPAASAAVREKIVADIRDMGKLPMVQAYWVAPCSAAIGPDEMQWLIVGDYRDADDYKSYADAPNHVAIRDVFVANTSTVAFLETML